MFPRHPITSSVSRTPHIPMEVSTTKQIRDVLHNRSSVDTMLHWTVPRHWPDSLILKHRSYFPHVLLFLCLPNRRSKMMGFVMTQYHKVTIRLILKIVSVGELWISFNTDAGKMRCALVSTGQSSFIDCCQLFTIHYSRVNIEFGTEKRLSLTAKYFSCQP